MIFDMYFSYIQFYYMASVVDKQHEQEYLKKLLGKHEGKGQTVANYLKLAQTNYQQRIKAGTFHVKETSDIIEHKKNENVSKIQAENMRYLKKSLQKNLKLIDSRIEQLTQPDKKSTKINDQQRLKFVSQMIKARKDLEKKRQQKINEQLEKDKDIQAKLSQQQRKKQQQNKQKRKQQILKRAESLEVARKNKRIEFQNQSKELKMKMEQKILSDRISQKFKQHQQNILEERKKKLAEIRSFHKPLSRSEFELHLEKIDKIKSERSRVVDKSQINRYINEPNKFYKSRWYEKTKNQQKTYEDEKHEQELEQVKQMKDKLKKYSEYVRQNFKPEIDEKKTKEISEKNKSAVQSPKTEDLRELGLKYLQFSKGQIDPSKKKTENEEEEKEFKIVKPINYLEELKKNSKGKKTQNVLENLKNNKNMTEPERTQKILDYASELERKAKMREQKAKLNNVLIDEELDNMYMEAIEMKLKMLGGESA